ncbi:MAG: HutD family protein [Intrasporangium sp.]|uniref:HutD/Ves family protein n=1 Tax=Intrasporangium sp. TaxID=1925024 RepID=UPI002647BA6A|nr:HutD family protein [Intrasporangium sp.]MDN5794399.1 HutD family protein [Intrasporangium sp.]
MSPTSDRDGMPPSALPDGFHPFAVAQIPAVPWKNGGGTTREVVGRPPGAGFDEFDWRVSIATIASDGPFSAFPGVDRTIMLLAGDGVRLRGAGVDHALDAVGEPFGFSGDLAIDSARLGGESTDFNVMTRRARCRAEVLLVERAGDLEPADAGLVMSLQGRWRLATEPTGTPGAETEVAPHEGIWWSGAGGIRAISSVAGTGDGDAPPRLVVVRIRPV